MSDYFNVYERRLNRFGRDYQSRIQGQRENNFENYLAKSLNRVLCKYINNPEYSFFGVFETNKQDTSKTQGYLLTDISVAIPSGTIISIANDIHPLAHEHEQDINYNEQWMIQWSEDDAARGYNKYTILKMTHLLAWENGDKQYSQLGYFSGPGAQAITSTMKSASNSAQYSERTSLYMFVTPYHADLKKDGYFEISYNSHLSAFVITDVDFITTPGVLYVSADPAYVRDKSPEPQKPEKPTIKDQEDYFWINGGNT